MEKIAEESIRIPLHTQAKKLNKDDFFFHA